MVALLKNVGKGILYIIGLPFFLIVLLGTAVMGILLLVFMFIKSIFLFFTGRSLDDDLPEDIKVKEIKNGGNTSTTTTANTTREEVHDEPVVQPYIAPTGNTTTIEDAVFGHQTYEAPTQEEPVIEEEPVVEEPVFEEEPQTSDDDVDEISTEDTATNDNNIGQYVPHTSGSLYIDEEEEETDSGVTITYGDEDDD